MEQEQEKQSRLKERTLLEALLYYFGIIWKRKWLVIAFTLAGAAGSVAFSIISLKLPPDRSPLPNTYRANAVLMFQESGAGMGTMSGLLSAFGIEEGRGDGGNMPQMALQVLKSRSFLDQLVEEFDIIEKYEIEEHKRYTSRKAILDNAQHSYNRENGTLEIHFEDIDPVFAKNIVNRHVEMLRDWFEKEGGTMKSEQIRLLEERLIEVEEQINELEGKIREFQQRYGVLDIREIAEQQNAAIANLREQLVQVEMEIRNYEEYLKIEDPTLARLRAQRDNILGMIAEIEQGRSGGDLAFPSKAQLPQIAAMFSRMQLELEIQMGLYQQLSERYEIAKLSAAEESLFKVLEWAEVPDKKSGPSRSKICMYATVLGLLAGIVIAFILNAASRIRQDPEKKKLLRGDE